MQTSKTQTNKTFSLSENKVFALSLDAMGTLIFLKEKPALVYRRLLLAEGIEAHKISELENNPKIFAFFWQEAEKKLPVPVRENFLDRYEVSPQNPVSFWHLMFTVIFRYFSLPQQKLETLLNKAVATFAQAELWQVEKTFLKLAEHCQKQQIPLWVTSNFDSYLPRLLKDLKIGGAFQKILCSARVGYEKPSARIFKTLQKEAALPAAQILHVGDMWSMDVEGALACDMQAAFYNPQKKELSSNNARVQQVQTLEQLIAFLN